MKSEVVLVRIQAASGLVFALFLAVHLANLAFAAGGAPAYDAFQRAARTGYQLPLLEAVVLGAMLVHAAVSVVRLLRSRGSPAPRRSIGARLHRIAGLFLLVFFAGHVAATRGASVFGGVFPEFAGVAFTLRWIPLYFYPYYTLLALFGLYHGARGVMLALPRLGVSVGRVRRWMIGALALLAVMLLAGLTRMAREPAPRGEVPYAAWLARIGVR